MGLLGLTLCMAIFNFSAYAEVSVSIFSGGQMISPGSRVGTPKVMIAEVVLVDSFQLFRNPSKTRANLSDHRAGSPSKIAVFIEAFNLKRGDDE